jgi:hypothetical protein
MKGIGYFQNLMNFLRNCLEIFWNFWGIFLEFFGEFFWRILAGYFWEKFLGRNFFWEEFLGRNFWGGFVWKEFFVYIVKVI